MEPSIQQWRESIGDRVREHTAPVVNRRIDRCTVGSLETALRQGRDGIVRRLAELDAEWDLDRAVMVNFAVVGGTAFATGLTRYTRRSVFGRRRKGFLYFFGTQLGFMLLHGLVGWCPPVSLFRRLGFRTQAEIESERSILLRELEFVRDGGNSPKHY